MSKSKPKFYVVWEGRRTGIFSNWADTEQQVAGFAGAKFKSFPSRAEAEQAYRGNYHDYTSRGSAAANATRSRPELERLGVNFDGIAVDAACAGVPGPLEYRGVLLDTGEEIFHQGPYEDGTNNIGEFLALVHALALLAQQGKPYVPIYSDSRTALAWVRDRQCRTKHERSSRNEELFRLIDRAEAWLRQNPVTNPLIKWETEEWGEVPADFGRK